MLRASATIHGFSDGDREKLSYTDLELIRKNGEAEKRKLEEYERLKKRRK